MGKRLDLDDAPATKVFREIVRTLATDGPLSAAVRADEWFTWTGEDDRQPLPEGAEIAVRLSPTLATDDWWSAAETLAHLTINVDFQVQTSCIDDVINFWWAIQRALYPPDDPAQVPPNAPSLAIGASLRAAGAQTGVMSFQGPMVVPDDKSADPVMTCRGMIRVEVSNLLNA